LNVNVAVYGTIMMKKGMSVLHAGNGRGGTSSPLIMRALKRLTVKILDKSIKLATQLFPTENKNHHFSFIYRRNKLLSIGQNGGMSPKVLYFANKFSVPLFRKYPYIHSEVDAISKIFGKIYIDSKLTMVNIRIGSGGMMLSKPCVKCQEIIEAVGLKVIYSTGDDNIFSN
jgi:hypothetical protein